MSGRKLVKKTDRDIINRGRNTLAGRRHHPQDGSPASGRRSCLIIDFKILGGKIYE